MVFYLDGAHIALSSLEKGVIVHANFLQSIQIRSDMDMKQRKRQKVLNSNCYHLLQDPGLKRSNPRKRLIQKKKILDITQYFGRGNRTHAKPTTINKSGSLEDIFFLVKEPLF
jgi:hypothetical protein